jgi:sugar phosphate isomerase/epimerase
MKLGVFIVLYADKTLEEALDTIEKYHFDAVEIGCGGFIPKAHCDPAELLKDKAKLKVFKNELTSRNLILSTLSCHGNVLHPDKSLAAQHEDDLKKAMQLCSELDLDRVVNFSGCPGDGTNAKTPNWITCPWPDYFLETLEWQWNECIIPKWIKLAEYGKRYGVTKICLEMHPGFSVYNPEKSGRRQYRFELRPEPPFLAGHRSGVSGTGAQGLHLSCACQGQCRLEGGRIEIRRAGDQGPGRELRPGVEFQDCRVRAR